MLIINEYHERNIYNFKQFPFLMNCRFCDLPLEATLIDLGHAPPSNSFLTKDMLSLPETTFPLCAKICDNCMLVQVEEQKITLKFLMKIMFTFPQCPNLGWNMRKNTLTTLYQDSKWVETVKS
jgi:hypothetical protein